MPEIWEDRLGLVNICINYVCQTHEIYQVLSYWVDFEAPENHWVRQCLVNVVLFRIKNL